MERTGVEYGARIERGVILSAEAGGYIVKSEDRPGVETTPIADIHGETHDVNEHVVFFMFDDGSGGILGQWS